ncbi:MAG: ATPase [Prevotellaceae bacterium]|jgi:N-acetylglucosamine kinase-like BadF-type ATPase|nr:ATPase [Prevotellaceae bacterium]
MNIIADSGSTKAEFKLLTENPEEKSIILPGINPFYQSETEIRELIHTELYPNVTGCDIQKIHFYGAGCAFPDKKKMLENALSYSFPQAEIFIESDLLAAARALFGTSKGVACILGTGSNSCLYNGHEIEKNVSPLGFILGDEGSGAVLGRKFISDCLKNQLPFSLQKKFFSQYNISPPEILDRVYKQPFPNRYLASFTPFLLENIGEEPIYQLVRKSFTGFFERNIKQYAITGEKVGFIGSIAYYFRDVLREVANELHYQLGKIERNPMEGLIRFHQEK